MVYLGQREIRSGEGVEHLGKTLADWQDGGETFDLVFCSGVLDRAPEPVSVLRRLISLTRSRLAVDLPIFTWRDALRGQISPLAAMASGEALMLVRQDRDAQGSGVSVRRFTRSAIETLVNGESPLFEPLRWCPYDGHRRAVMIADKRRIGHMVVVCAPTSGGKSTIAERILRDPLFRRRLALDEADWEIVKAEDFFSGWIPKTQNVIVMYNLLRRLNKSLDPEHGDPLPAILAEPERVTFVTLLPPPDRLRQQFQRSEMADPDARYSAKILRLRDSYQDDRFLLPWYEDWFALAENQKRPETRRWLVRFDTDDGSIQDGAHWRDAVRDLYGT